MEFLSEYGLFLAKAVTIVVAVVAIITAIATAARAGTPDDGDSLKIRDLNQRFKRMKGSLDAQLLSSDEIKNAAKEQKKADRARAKARRKGNAESRPRVFVLDFDGDIRASAVDSLREEVSAVLQVAQENDEVLVRLESQGGMVHSYGLAASQLKRIRDRGIRLTAAVDKVAASGGYMMACVADRIIAAPFAVIGSIGVVGQLPNFNRLLRELNIDYEMHTAGEHKRTLSLFGENSDQARDKFREELQDTHELFKSFVRENRRVVDIEAVATGEHWFGTRALDLKLVDDLRTSDDYLMDACDHADVVSVQFESRKTLGEKIASAIQNSRLGALLG